MKTPSFRRILKFLGKLFLGGGLLTVGLLVLLPYYWGLVLPLVLPDGVEYESYERLDYGHFALKGVEFQGDGMEVKVSRLEALMPGRWLRRSWAGSHDENVIKAGQVFVGIGSSSRKEDDPVAFSWTSVLSAVDRSVDALDYWLPMAEVEGLSLETGSEHVAFESLVWNERQLRGRMSLPERSAETAELKLGFQSGQLDAVLEAKAYRFQTDACFRWEEEQPKLDVCVDWDGNPMTARAVFGDDSWLPREASWSAEAWTLTSSIFGWEFPYEAIHFDWSGGWSEGVFKNDLQGHAQPDTTHSDLPDVEFACHLSGDFETLQVEALSLNAPGLHAELDKPVGIRYADMMLSDRLGFVVDGDLSALQVEGLSGVFNGAIDLDSKGNAGAVGSFKAQADGVEWGTFHLDELQVDGEVDGTELRVKTLEAKLGGDSSVAGSLEANFRERMISSSHFDFKLRPGFLGSYLPDGYQLQGLDARLDLEGPLADLNHQLEAEVLGLESDKLQPMSVTLSSKGKLFNEGSVALSVSAGDDAHLACDADYAQQEGVWRWDIHDFAYSGQDALTMKLEAPSQLVFSMGEAPDVHLSESSITDGERLLQARLEWNSFIKEIVLSASGLDLRVLLSAWLKRPVPNVLIRSIDGKARLEQGLWLASLEADAVVRQGEEEIGFTAQIQADDTGLLIEDLQVADERHTWVSAHGHLPVLFGPSFDGQYQVELSAPLELALQTENHQAWIDLINPVLPLPLKRFNASVQLNGSLEQPEGVVNMSLATVGGDGEQAMPPVQVEVDGVLHGRQLGLEQLRMAVKDQLFSARGEVVFPERAIPFLLDRSIEVDWKQTAFDFSVDDSSLVPLAYFLNDYIRPNGKLEAKLQGNLSDGFDGEVHLSGMSSKAVFPFGSFREVSADLVFDDSRAELQSFVGKIGREPVTLRGSVDYGDIHNPEYQLSLRGEGLPLVRKAGVLLRADLDLSAKGNRKDGVLVGGRIVLKDGLYMLNLADLVSGNGGQSAESRPPYFSVATEPFNRWKLDVDIVGERFMSLYTPALEVVVSMDMNLLGSLQDPYLQGEIVVDEGAVLFPFANFKINQGEVLFPVEDPYHPKLELQASCQRLDYDLLLLASGDALDPELIFDSNPPLTSDQIIKLVIAGENPENTLDYQATTRASRIGTYMTMGLLGSGPGSNGWGSRFSMNSGSSLSRQGKETMQMEFMLDDDWYLVGEYDEYDAWNGGVRWRILNPVKKRRAEASDDAE